MTWLINRRTLVVIAVSAVMVAVAALTGLADFEWSL